MKNSAFRSYSRKILKSEVFISIIIVFVLVLGIIGSSYALYMDVDTDTDYELVNVGDLKIGFANGDNSITLENMTPTEDDIAIAKNDNIFSFYIYNAGTYTAIYNVKLVTDEYNEVDTKYINYQICKDNSSNCEEINTLSNVEDSIIYNDIITPKKENDDTDPNSYYFIRIWINNTYNETINKKIKLKVIIDAKNADSSYDNNNTLTGALLNNKDLTIYNLKPDLSNAGDGVYKVKDNYGISYYFRGDIIDNYVILNNMCFKAYRIEGDGSVRLILYNLENNCNDSNWDIGKSNSDNENVLNNFSSKLVLDNLKKSVYCSNDLDSYSLICDDNNDSYIGTLSKNELILSKYSLSGEYWLSTKSNNTKYGINPDGKEELFTDKVLSNRPVITLNKNSLIKSGNGSVDTPYIIK